MRIDSRLPLVLVDRIQIEQVLLNLLRNASEAVAGCQRQKIAVEAVARGGRVEVSVSDTGSGLAAEVADRLFEPFVTTKSDGLGVGLSICRMIVEAHGGRLWTEANPGGGTIFRFALDEVVEDDGPYEN